jgi:hypothetical protein
VLGRGAAAAAHDLRAALHEVPRVGGDVLGARHVHAPAPHLARHAGVGHRRELPPRRRRHLLHGLEDRLRADRAVEADHVGPPAVERAGDVGGRGPIRGAQVGPDGHLGEHGHGGVDVARGEDGLLDLVQIAERLEDHAVGAAVPERGDLLAEERPGLVASRGAVGLDAHAERADGPRHEHRHPRAALRPRVGVGRLARQFGAAPVDGAHLPLEPVLRELEPVGAERVRLQHLGPGRGVRRVQAAHELGGPQGQLVVALVDEHAARIELGSHGAVEQHDLGGVQQAVEGGAAVGHGAGGTRAGTRPIRLAGLLYLIIRING